MTSDPRVRLCPLCNEPVFPTRSIHVSRQDDAALQLARGTLPTAHLAICAFCTSLLGCDGTSDEGEYRVVGPSAYQQLPSGFRQRIQELACALERAQRPPGALRLLLAARGDLFVAAVVYANGHMIASQPCQSPEEAGRLLSHSEFVDMQIQLANPAPVVWFGRARMEIFPGRIKTLGPWGPYASAAEARQASTTAAKCAATELGAIPLEHKVSEPRCQN